jgi:hypothetical protein
MTGVSILEKGATNMKRGKIGMNLGVFDIVIGSIIVNSGFCVVYVFFIQK